jgi:hypothetical protein
VAGIAGLASARADRRHARAFQRFLGTHGRERNDSPGRDRFGADDRLEVDLDEFAAEVLCPEILEEGRIAADRRLVEVAADGDPRLVGDASGCAYPCRRRA